MIVNKISNITFKESELQSGADTKNAILMLRDKNASIKFLQNRGIADNADASSVGPLKALGYKLYRTFSMLKEEIPQETETQNQKHINTVA